MPRLRSQDLKNRQNSIDDLEFEQINEMQHEIDIHFREGMALYKKLLDKGVAKECARAVLPSNTVTRLYMSGTLRSWLHYIDLRGDNGTQLEHQRIARSIGDILSFKCPTICNAMWG